LRIQARIHPSRIAFEYLALVGVGNRQGIDVALGVVEILAGLRVDAAPVVIGGIVSSTLLTLLVLPVLYRWLHRERAEHGRAG